MEKLIIFLLIAAFSIIKSMMDKAAERKALQARPPAVPPQNHKERVQSELEAFLAEARGGAGKAAPPQQAARPGQPASMRPEGQRSGQSQRAAGRQTSGSGQPRQKQPKAASRSQQTPRRQKPAAEQPTGAQPGTPLGAGVREHVSQHIGQHVQQHMKNMLDDRVRTDLRTGLQREGDAQRQAASAEQASTAAQSAAVRTGIVDALRSPAGVRQAILVSEILARPRVLRRPGQAADAGESVR